MAPWFAPQLFITEYTSLNAGLSHKRGTNQVVGQVGSVRIFNILWISGSMSTVHPSANCNTGPGMHVKIIFDYHQKYPLHDPKYKA